MPLSPRPPHTSGAPPHLARRAPGEGLHPGFSNEERLGLEKIFAQMHTSAAKDLRRIHTALDAEGLASGLWGVWYGRELIGQNAQTVFGDGLITHLAARRTQVALTLLRLFAVVAPPPYDRRAGRAAGVLSAAGLPEPPWAGDLGTARPTRAFILRDPVHDDAASVFVGFEQAGAEHTISVLIDFNQGGIAKDVLVIPASPDEIEARARSQDRDGGEVAAISLAEAAARASAAFAETDRIWEPELAQTFRSFNALARARTRLLPRGGKVPSPRPPSKARRTALLAGFCRDDLTADLRRRLAPDDLEYLGEAALSFSLDYTAGTPLRFSPVMVEIFCRFWAPSKLTVEPEILAALPDVLRAWIAFAGRTRDLPAAAVGESIQAVARWQGELITASRDPANWGPAKTLVTAMLDRGIDPMDREAVDAFVEETNRRGGLDALRHEPEPDKVIPMPRKPKRRH